MADAISRVTSGRRIGACCMQNAPMVRPEVTREIASAM